MMMMMSMLIVMITRPPLLKARYDDHLHDQRGEQRVEKPLPATPGQNGGHPAQGRVQRTG
jgi:hypothetical protein